MLVKNQNLIFHFRIFSRLLLLVLMTWLGIGHGFSQIAFWQKYFGGKNYDRGRKMVLMPDGTLVIAGDVYSMDGLGENNHSRNGDWVIMKYATQGKVFWKHTYGGTGQEELADVILTSDQGFLCVGTAASGDGDVGINNGSTDIWVVKLDPLGKIEWSRVFGGSGDDRGTTAIELSGGGYLIGGESGSTDGNSRSPHHGGLDSWVAKIGINGRLLWEKHYGGSGNEKVSRLHEISPSKFLVINSSDSQDSSIVDPLGKKDAWVLEVDDSGHINWQKSFGGEENDDIHGSVIDHQGNLVMVGTTFSSGGQIPRHRGLGDFWILKTDLTGRLIWSQTLGGTREEGLNDIILSADSNYVVCGMSKSRAGDGDIEYNSGYYDGWLAKINPAGQKMWSRTLGYMGADGMDQVVQTPQGGYLMIGYSQVPRRTIPYPGHHGSADIWVANFGDPAKPSLRPYVTPPLMFGVVKDKDNGTFLDARVILTNNATLDSITGTKSSPEDGSFVMLLPSYGLVSVNVLTPGYLFYGEDILLDTLNGETSIDKTIELEAIRIGSSLVLKNIYFETGKWNLLQPSFAELERVVAFMNLNPRVQILVSGHTDDTGNKAEKVQLSLNRANAVKAYLVKRGIMDARMKVKGYGMYRPIASNRTEAGRRQNRRVEFEVINM